MPTDLSRRHRLAVPTVAVGDRCDRCPAVARYRAVLSSGALLFCGHHAREHRARLLEIGAELGPVPSGPVPEKGQPA
ncbi:DUF7455 domain-containing protein [Geodermatophilus sp. SYSU D00708]